MPLAKLQAAYGEEHAAWLSDLARGVDAAEVTPRLLTKSLSCGKTFRGNKALMALDSGALPSGCVAYRC